MLAAYPHRQRQILYRHFRVVGANGDLDAAFCQDRSIFRGKRCHFGLAPVTDNRSYHRRAAFLRQLVSYKISVGAVDKSVVQTELPCYPHRCKNVVCPVAVEMRLDTPVKKRQQSLALYVIFGHIPVLVLGFFNILSVTLCLKKSLSYHRSYRHSRHGSFVTVIVGHFRVLAQRKFYPHLSQGHFIYTLACSLYPVYLPCNSVCRAGRYHRRRNACLSCKFKGVVKGIYPVDYPQLRRAGIHRLVKVLALKANSARGQSKMCVAVDKAGEKALSLCVYVALAVRRTFSDLRYPSADDLNKAVFDDGEIPVAGINFSVYYLHFPCYPLSSG